MGGGVNTIGGSLQDGIPEFFHIIFLPVLKTSFVFKREWLKFLKNPFEEDSPIVVLEISHILSFLYIYVFWKFHVSSLNG